MSLSTLIAAPLVLKDKISTVSGAHSFGQMGLVHGLDHAPHIRIEPWGPMLPSWLGSGLGACATTAQLPCAGIRLFAALHAPLVCRAMACGALHQSVGSPIGQITQCQGLDLAHRPEVKHPSCGFSTSGY